MADLKLTVDISDLNTAKKAVKELDNQTINVKFNVTGLEEISKLNQSFSSSAKGIDAATTSANNLGNAIKKATTVDSSGATKEVTTYNKALGETVTLIEKVNAKGKESSSTTTTTIDSEKTQLANIEKKRSLLNEINKIQTQDLSKFANQSGLSSLSKELESLSTSSTGFANRFSEIKTSVSGFKAEAQSAAYASNSLKKANDDNLLSMSNIGESMKVAAIRTLEWSVTMGVLYGTLNGIKSMIGISTAVSDQMTSIQMVTGASTEQAKSMLSTYQSIATEMSSTTTEVAASAETWLRQGRTISDTNSLIETSTVLSKVGFMDANTAAQLLTSSINGYGIAATDAMSVVDKMSAIDVAAATSTEDLATAMSQTASGAKIAGVSMDELLSYIATIEDVTQASADTVGVSLKTIFSRINSVKLGSLTDGDGEDVSRVETVLKEYGITLRDTNGTFKETGSILDELSVKWKTLSGAEKSEIAQQFAGVHQKEKFLVLMENYDKALALQTVSENSAGSAQEKMSKWAQTTEAAVNRLTNQWQILSTKLVDSNVTKAIVNLGTLSLEGLNTDFGQFTIKLVGAAAAFLAFVAVVEKAKKAFAAFSETGIGGALVTNVSGAFASTKNIAQAAKEYNLAKTAASELGVAMNTAAVAQTTFETGTIAAGVATGGLVGGLKAARVALLGFIATPIGGALAAITALTTALTVGYLFLDAATTNYSEHAELLEKANSSYTENATKIEDLKKQSSELNTEIYKMMAAGADSSTNSELANLIAKNDQLTAEIESLKIIQQLNKETASNEAHALINSMTETSDTKYNVASAGPTTAVAPQQVTKPDKVIEYAQMISDTEDKINSLTDSYNKGEKTAQQYNDGYTKYTNQQKEYSKNANELASTINEQAKSLDLSTDAGKADYAIIQKMNDALKESNKLTGMTAETSTVVAGVQTGSEAAATEVQDLDSYSSAVSSLQSGLSSGLTDSTNFYDALSKLFGDTPPTNLSDSLSTLTALFSDGEDASAQMLSVLDNGYKTANGYDLGKLQSDLHLSGSAIDVINGRLAEMGLLLPNAFGSSITADINAMGNGLGLTSEASVNLESEIANLYNSVKSGTNDLGSATVELTDYLSALGLSDSQISGILTNWDYLFSGLKESTITAFSGLQGNADIQAAADSAFQTFSDVLAQNGADNQVTLDAAVDTSALQANVRAAMVAAGGYTEEEIQQYCTDYSNREIQIQLNATASAKVDTVIPAGDANDQITQAIQDNYDESTKSFDVEGVKGQIKDVQVEGMPDVQEKITSLIQGLNTQTGAALNPVVISVSETGADETKQSFSDAYAAVQILNGTSLDSITGEAGGLAGQVQSVEGATQSTMNKLTELNGISLVDKSATYTVNFVATGSTQAINSASGGIASIVGPFATGSINIQTKKEGLTESLVGEEGEEALLRNGKLTYIGTKGAEIIPIQDGDTILPADVTKRIKNGQIPMYATGKYSVKAYSGSTTAPKSYNGDTSKRWGANYGDEPEDDAAKDAYDAHKKAFDKQYDYLQYLRDMDQIDEETYYKRLESLNNQYFLDKNEYLDEYRDHEAEVYAYLKKKEEDRLNDLKDDYDSVVSAVTNIIDTQLDAIKGANELADAQEAYDNIKDQKNVRVYRNGKWTYEADQEALTEAENDLTKAKLEDYKAKWESITTNYENAQDDLIAKQVLGADYEKKILEGRLDILQQFATKYSSVLSDLSSINGEGNIPSLDYSKAWISLNSYAKGTTSAKGGLARINDGGGTELRVLNSGDGILTANITKNLSALGAIAPNLANQLSSSDTYFNIDTLELKNVSDINSFISGAKQFANTHKSKKGI